MKTQSIKDNLSKIFFVLFSVVFCGLTFTTIFLNKELQCNPIFAGLFLILFSGVLYLTNKVTSKKEIFFIKHKIKILIAFTVCMLIIQIPAGYLMSVNPIGDVQAVYEGAQSFVTTDSIVDYEHYFYIFPNNLAGLYIFELLFSICSFFNIDNYFAIGIIFNAILIDITIIFMFLTIEKLFDIKKAILVLKICGLCLPMYFYIPVFYTDIISMSLIAIGFYFFVLSQKSEKTSQKNLFFILCGLVFVLGALVKMTVIILLVAAIIEMVITNDFKKIILPILSVFIIFTVVFQAFNLYTYNFVLDKEIADKENIPYSHWIMMGLKDEGRYNYDDFLITTSVDGKENRTELNIKEIKNRISEYGLTGYIKLIARKGACSFGSGTYGVELMINNGIRHPNILHEFVLVNGKYYNIFVSITQGLHWLILILTVFAAIKYIKRKPEKGIICAFASLFGLYLFLMIWESNPRYIFNFLPIFIIGAISGLEKNDKRSNKICHNQK